MTASSPQPKNALRLVFFGSGAFGLPTLKHLASTHQIEAVVTQPDRPAGRKRALTPTPIGAWAEEHLPSVPLLKPENVNEADQLDLVRSFDVGSPDERRGGWVVIAFGQKLSKRLLADRFAINLHASLLPRWRGAAPINHAILAGDSVTGNSVITLADRMDAGLVLGQSERPSPSKPQRASCTTNSPATARRSSIACSASSPAVNSGRPNRTTRRSRSLANSTKDSVQSISARSVLKWLAGRSML
ncbi:MAG: methionyl-tRNA formyltransferase [Phycisphaerales bacterium]